MTLSDVLGESEGVNPYSALVFMSCVQIYKQKDQQSKFE